MKLNISHLSKFYWFLLSWGVIVFSLFNLALNQVVLKILVPVIFISVIFLEGKKFLFNNYLLIYIVFFLWASMSIFYTINMEDTLKYLQQLLGNIIIWYTTIRLFAYLSNKYTFFLILGLAFLFHAIYAFMFPNIDDETFRLAGLYTNSNALGFAMFYGVVIINFLYNFSKNTRSKIIFIVIIVFMIAALFETGSRKSVLAVTISLAITLFLVNRKKSLKLILISFFVFVITIGSNFMTGYLTETAFGKRIEATEVEQSANVRADLISEGFGFFIDHPFLGIGLGSFTSYSSMGIMSHNDFIEILSSMGLIGLFIYISIFFLFFKDIQFLIKFKGTNKIGIIATSFIVGYLILGMGHPAFLSPVSILVFASFQALIEHEVNRVKSKIYEINEGID